MSISSYPSELFSTEGPDWIREAKESGVCGPWDFLALYLNYKRTPNYDGGSEWKRKAYFLGSSIRNAYRNVSGKQASELFDGSPKKVMGKEQKLELLGALRSWVWSPVNDKGEYATRGYEDWDSPDVLNISRMLGTKEFLEVVRLARSAAAEYIASELSKVDRRSLKMAIAIMDCEEVGG